MISKETTQGSFLKYTAHQFKKMLANEGGNKLESYRVDAGNKQYEFWQRDSWLYIYIQRRLPIKSWIILIIIPVQHIGF